MIALTLAEIAEIVGGQTYDIPDPGARVTGPVVIDSRAVEPGSLFAAFHGENVDGHDYAERAVAAGAAAVLAARPVGVPAIVVDDVQSALGRLARAVVERLGTQVVALTGSAGKTSTKDLIAQVLQQKAPTVWTPGSLNNEIGLPLTALRATEETEHLVLEMGARGIGHIRYLTELTPPRIGLVLNVGTAHIGEFGGREQIAEAKGEMVESSRPTASPSSMPTTRWCGPWNPGQRPVCCSSASPRTPPYARRMSGSRSSDSLPSHSTHPPGAVT